MSVQQLAAAANPAQQTKKDESCTTVKMEQLAPSDLVVRANQALVAQTRMSLAVSKERRGGGNAAQSTPKGVRSYYRRQEELIDALGNLTNNGKNLPDRNLEKTTRRSFCMAKASFFLNLGLLVVKAVASAFSGSLSVISSAVDSSIDLVSGILFWYTSRKIEQKHNLLYPTGRKRLEPVAIMILSTIMSVAAFQLVVESIREMVFISSRNGETSIVFDAFTIGVLGITMVSKCVFYFICREIATPTAQALAQDHRNDVLSNMVAAGGGFVGHHFWSYADPAAAIGISIYIFVIWWRTGSD